MANNTLSLNSIKNILYSISVAHKMINDFGYGPTYDITTKPRRYPLLWVEPTSSSAEMVDGRIQQFNYSFSVGVWDKIKKGDINFDDTLSDTNAIHQHIVTLISQHPLYVQLNLSLVGSVIWEAYIHEDDADLNGYIATLTFKVPNRFTPCNIPVLPTLSYSESLGPNTVEYRLIGPQGFTGPQGLIGPTGVDGIIGANGVTGSQGPQGVQGNQGTGVQGAIGETGLQGPQGTQGEIGYQGNQGDFGPIGYQGIDGTQGSQGTQGNQGNQGPQGSQGVQGIIGLTGPQGLLGNQGNQGVKGNQGDFGPIGPAGLIWRGLWSSTATYSINDSVGYASASWFLFTASFPSGYYGPTSAPPNVDFAHWALLAAQGAPGQMGPQGWQGIIGPTGASGVLGTTASSSVSADMDNFGEVITTGSKGYVRMPYNATINQWSMLADQTGSATIDIRRNGSSIIGTGNKPTLVSAQSGLTGISGWIASALSRNDVLEWVVESASVITRLNVSLFLTRGV